MGGSFNAGAVRASVWGTGLFGEGGERLFG